MYYVYAISSLERNYIYVGLTNNIERRFSEHNSGKIKLQNHIHLLYLFMSKNVAPELKLELKKNILKAESGKRN
jgi:putative endonuclease